MRSFVNWWTRFPGRQAAPTLLTGLAVIGALGDWAALLQALCRSSGFYWG
jgi:hypothetical protein